MTELETVAEELAKLLAKHGGKFVKGKTPHVQLARLYQRFANASRREAPWKSAVELKLEFGQMCDKNSNWVHLYVMLARLHPRLLDKINVVEEDRLYLTITVAIKLAARPLNLQEEIWSRSKALAGGRQSNLWALVHKLSKELLKRGKLPPVGRTTSAPKKTPAPTEAPIVTPTPAPKLNLPPDPRAVEDEKFLKILAQTKIYDRRTRTDDIAPTKEPRQWHGDREIHKSSGYGNAKDDSFDE